MSGCKNGIFSEVFKTQYFATAMTDSKHTSIMTNMWSTNLQKRESKYCVGKRLLRPTTQHIYTIIVLDTIMSTITTKHFKTKLLTR